MKSYKDQIKDTFKQTKEVSCPAFGGNKIYFNAKGINHLLYKGSRSRRDNKRIETNIRLLPRAIKVLQAMPYFQEESNYKKENVSYKFWAFEAVINDRRIKVVIRQVGNGQKHFWSVIPAWRKDRFGIINARKKNLEE
ncbi:hypothetical protein COT49_03030 [candidate division WWE3 bacterium CG08_land_8_20_14_0_20_40_13]|uniref:Phage-Barnase-EndoU-ColicinE5/D-RelE like nuclease 3 domain-containing protein n=1 Tax=candidate division WWE3 bacterium CG08_land_8_20_14_0_20_40_13 TaxID=1975084 RepID=A0A2H0XD59_UNCKA|nr:MAG: hypothetical protein COT49_03030 [candidate division WWE3 bacterium CG08_land_8_20_14_0_20_40_13]